MPTAKKQPYQANKSTAVLPPSSSPEPTKKETWRNIISTLMVFLTAPLLALLIVGFVFQSYEVDGRSMHNTLEHRDRLIIWKLPRTWARITKHDYIPRRGDVVVFNSRAVSGTQKQLIKRVVGLPGERVVIAGGILTVYNTDKPEGFQPDKSLPFGEIVGNTEGNIDVTVPAGTVYVLGDNRVDSTDSRILGPIDAEHIIGKMTARILPLSEAKKF
jgi:signal peptidase I